METPAAAAEEAIASNHCQPFLIAKELQRLASLPAKHHEVLEREEKKCQTIGAPILSYVKLVHLQERRRQKETKMDDFATTQAEIDLFEDDFTPTIPNNSSSIAVPPPAAGSPDYASWHSNNPGYENGSSGNEYKPSDHQMATEDVSAAVIPATTKPQEGTPRNKITEHREPGAVRGDRSGTGGVKKPKMTEAELAERMEKMRLKSEQRAKQHDRQEADKAAQSQLEKLNQQKHREEQKATREQEMERAKNQQRKLKAQGGREWDSEKQESDIVDRSRGQSSMYSRGAHGGVSRGLENSRYATDREDNTEQGGYFRGRDGRGRGGRGPRGGRGGRGGRGVASHPTPTSVPPTDSTEAFPSLPVATPAIQATQTATITPKPSALEERTSSIGAWAEEMATPSAE